jgi:hypothetical protein
MPLGREGFVMDRGYVALWRKSLDSRVFKNAEMWQLWTWCLMKANHDPGFCEIVTGKGRSTVPVNPGSFVFGRNQAAKELGQKPSGLWNRCLSLQRLGNINIQSDSHYSIITIINWEIYQPKKKKTDKQPDSQLTGNRQPNDTNNNDKNEKKEDKRLCSSGDEPDVQDFSTALPEVKPKREGYETKKHEFLNGKILDAYNAFWTAWNGNCSWAVAKNDAADVFREIFLKTPREERKALFDRILSGASCEARGRQLKKDNGSTPVNPARWLREERWEQYDYRPPTDLQTPNALHKTQLKTPQEIEEERWNALTDEQKAAEKAELDRIHAETVALIGKKEWKKPPKKPKEQAEPENINDKIKEMFPRLQPGRKVLT